jgi:hypothetical protein
MLRLHELQSAFVAAVQGDTAHADVLRRHIAGDRLSPERRLEVYANTVSVNRRNVLRAVYPVIERLVGAEFFAYAADSFSRSFPSRSGNLDDFGAEFPDFLAGFAPAASLPYLPDVARLELAIDRLAVAADPSPGMQTVEAIGAEDGFTLSPACRLIGSAFPILRIWQVNQPEHDGNDIVDLAQGPAHLLAYRNGFMVEIAEIGPGEFTLLSLLAAGASVGAAIAAAVERAGDFDPAASLGRRLADGTLRRPHSDTSLGNGEHHGL